MLACLPAFSCCVQQTHRACPRKRCVRSSQTKTDEKSARLQIYSRWRIFPFAQRCGSLLLFSAQFGLSSLSAHPQRSMSAKSLKIPSITGVARFISTIGWRIATSRDFHCLRPPIFSLIQNARPKTSILGKILLVLRRIMYRKWMPSLDHSFCSAPLQMPSKNSQENLHFSVSCQSLC